jgi:hypothetical protein
MTGRVRSADSWTASANATRAACAGRARTCRTRASHCSAAARRRAPRFAGAAARNGTDSPTGFAETRGLATRRRAARSNRGSAARAATHRDACASRLPAAPRPAGAGTRDVNAAGL